MPTRGDLYREICQDYRHHLGWRERLLAGFVAVTAALAFAFHNWANTSRFDRGIIAVAGTIISVAIFFLEERTHEIIMHRREIGHALEQRVGHAGVHASGTLLQTNPLTFTHATVLRVLYLLGAVT